MVCLAAMARKLIVAGLFASAAILDVHNAWVALPFSGFDGPGHAAYIGILHFEGRLPLATEGWSTPHPPFYYALCALLWGLLPSDLSSHTVLFAMRSIGVAAALGIGFAAHASARLLAPQRPNLAVYAAAILLFLPMYMGPAARLGNEVLAAALSAISVWLLLRCLERPDELRRAVLLGGVLGLAVLTKFSALVVLATAGIALLVSGWRKHGLRATALRNAAVVGVAALLCSGWYFVRNVYHHGRPIVIQSELVAQAMKQQGYGPSRPITRYLDVNPDILLNPRHFPPAFAAVGPATFATIWYDPYGQTMDVTSRWARRFAWLLFGCGALISACAYVGLATALERRQGWVVPLAVPTLLVLGLLTLASYLGFTYRVATYSAIKGTYLSPGLLAFALFAAHGLDVLSRRSRGFEGAVRVLLVIYVAAVLMSFWSGWLAPTEINHAYSHLRGHWDVPTERVVRVFLPQAISGGQEPGPTPRAGDS